MECAQIRITGAGGNASPPTVSIPGLYKGMKASFTSFLRKR
jgi:hypothetical protein